MDICPFCDEEVMAGGAYARNQETEDGLPFLRCHSVCYVQSFNRDED